MARTNSISAVNKGFMSKIDPDEMMKPDIRDSRAWPRYLRMILRRIRLDGYATSASLVRAGIRDHYLFGMALEDLAGAGFIVEGGSVLTPRWYPVKGVG